MRDYAELVKAWRYCTVSKTCDGCPMQKNCPEINHQIVAADAIEELLAAFCLLCGICTSPPSTEDFNSCEIARRYFPVPPKEVE